MKKLLFLSMAFIATGIYSASSNNNLHVANHFGDKIKFDIGTNSISLEDNTQTDLAPGRFSGISADNELWKIYDMSDTSNNIPNEFIDFGAGGMLYILPVGILYFKGDGDNSGLYSPWHIKLKQD